MSSGSGWTLIMKAGGNSKFLQLAARFADSIQSMVQIFAIQVRTGRTDCH